MKPYIAILIDSFWEAVGNKVLWALLIGWTLILAGLAPFGYITENSYRLTSADIREHSDAVKRLSDAAKGRDTAMLQAIADKLSPKFRERLATLGDKDSPEFKEITPSRLASELNAAVKSSDLFDSSVFAIEGSKRRQEKLQPILDIPADRRSTEDNEELNRELLQMALPRELNRALGEQLWIGYGSFKIGDPLPLSRRTINEYIEPLVLGSIVKFGLGVLAVFIAIVVTSPIIPDTFRSGSLHLLLSKPISRVLLYLSKFFGGTIFVLVNISFVLVGLYFIAGLRFGIWNSGLLACIPILMFVFVIFYSVSALAALLWGNAIVCVVACMVFWLFCFVVGTIHNAMMTQIEVANQIIRIAPLGEELLTVNGNGELSVWNKDFGVWQPATEPETRRQSRTFGPFYDPENNQIVTKSFFRDPFGGLGARARNLVLLAQSSTRDSASPQTDDLEAVQETKQKTAPTTDSPGVDDAIDTGAITSVSDARKKPRWLSDSGPALPEQMFDLLEFNGSLVAVCRSGIFQMPFQQLEVVAKSKQDLFGLQIPWLKKKEFANITPPGYFPDRNTYASVTADGQGLIIYSSGNLDFMKPDGKALAIVASTKIESEDIESNGTEAALVEMNSAYCVVARDTLPLLIFDADLQNSRSLDLPDGFKFRQLAWRGGSNLLAILLHTGEIYTLDCKTLELTQLTLPVSSDCTSMHWLSESELWCCTKPNSAFRIDVATASILDSRIPKSTLWGNIFRWAVHPIYLANPKPAALDDAMGYVLSGNKTQSLDIVANNLENAQVELDVWQPILTNLAFVATMLGIGCIYVLRKEF